jgi:hypothetical protein
MLRGGVDQFRGVNPCGSSEQTKARGDARQLCTYPARDDAALRLAEHGDARGKKVVGLILRRKLGATGQADVVTLDVWRRFASFHRHVERPILGADFTFFPLKDLPDGRFLYAFRLAGKTIASSRFVNPAPCKTYYGWQQPPCRR